MDLQAMQLVHDLKMPIQLIYSCVQLLEMEFSSNARAEGYLQMLSKSADQLQHMVYRALDMDSPAEKSALEVRDVVADARMASRQSALCAGRKDVRVHFETNVAQFRMPMDGEKLKRILDNLLSNALRFAHGGGHVSLAVWVRGDGVDFVVADDGCGIPGEKQAVLFDLGAQGDGHGYGLGIVREYARALGGDVYVKSTPGKGSRFTVRLPLRSSCKT